MTTLEVGSQLGPYRIAGYIGRGGMGVVYRAEHVHLGRHVALKLLAPELAQNESFRERFVRESRAAAQVDHPNVIPIYEASEIDGHYIIAMRFVDGVDLREVLHTRGPLPLERAIEVLTQVAGALDAAHAQGLVHRDVKPGNILVVGGSEHCYLTDFGLTKAITSDTAFTATGQFVGTADYVAPEQIEGKELDRRTDVYSLGCVFYECLAGMTPFRRETDMAVMWAHMQEPPPRVTERRRDLPAELDAVIATAMAKSKDHRYPSCSTFAAAARSAVEVGTGRSVQASIPAPLPVSPTPAAGYPPTPVVASGAYTSPGDALPPQQYYAGGGSSYPPAAVTAPRKRQRPMTAIALVIAAVLVAAGGTGAALIVTHKKNDRTVAAAPVAATTTVTTVAKAPKRVQTARQAAPPPTPVTTPQPTPTPAETPGSGGSLGAEAEQTVHDYWKTLAAGDTSGAYDFLDPQSVSLSRESWMAARGRDGLFSAKFNQLATTSSDSSSATVAVDLETKQDSCPPQHWTGGVYNLVRSGGRWLIHDHHFSNKPPC